MLQLDNNPHWNSVLQCWNKAKKSNEIGQKQSARGVLKKVAPKICWRTHMRISIKLQTNFIEITFLHGCSPVDLLDIFRTHFYKNNFEGLVLIGKE